MLQKIVGDKLISALDIGTSKICCLIARIGSKGSIDIIGEGISQSSGFKSGKITDFRKLTNAIRSAVALAEDRIDDSIKKVVVNISSPSLQSQLIGADAQLSSAPIGNSDVDRVLSQALGHLLNENEKVLHRIPLSYSIDGDDDKVDPRGMRGSVLGVEINVISTNRTPLDNLVEALNACFLDVANKVATPFASALACLTDDEKDLGTILLDIGGGTTSIAVMEKNRLEYATTIPLGGYHITNDIAQILAISPAKAEELKTLEGSTFVAPADNAVMVNVVPIGESGTAGTVPVPKSQLIEIIQARALEILEKAKERLIEDNFYDVTRKRIVLTGGTSMLQGIREAASLVFDDRQTRIGYPIMPNLPKDLESPIFVTAIGLLKYAADMEEHDSVQDTGILKLTQKFRRIGKWCSQSF